MKSSHFNLWMSLGCVLLVAGGIDGAPARALLQAAEAPVEPSRTINGILSQGTSLVFNGATVPQPEPVAEAPGLAPQPSTRPKGSNEILFTCRAIGQQVYTPGAYGSYVNSGAQATLWCGPTSTSKIAVTHFFSGPAPTGTDRVELFTGGFPTFEAANGDGIVVTKALERSAPAPASSRDGMSINNGGFGSVPDTLLQATEAKGTFSDVTFVVRNNEIGGVLPPGLQPLPTDSASLQNFGGTGAEGKSNPPVLIPYQADYTFFTGATQPSLISGAYFSSVPAGDLPPPTLPSGRR